jgi:hypothetical protein
MVARPLPARRLTVGFLETIGQRHQSRPRDSRPAAVQAPIWDDSLGAVHAAPVQETAALASARCGRSSGSRCSSEVAAVGVAAWLGIRKASTPVVPTTSAADAPSAEPKPVDKPDAAPTSTRRRPILRSPGSPERATGTKLLQIALRRRRKHRRLSRRSHVRQRCRRGSSTGTTVIESQSGRARHSLAEDNFVYSSDGTG